MKRYGENIEDAHMVEKSIHSNDSKFDLVAMDINQSKNMDMMIVDELQGSCYLMKRSRSKKKKPLIQAFVAKVLLKDIRSNAILVPTQKEVDKVVAMEKEEVIMEFWT